ncbi:MAG: TonB-dependent receptor [Prolixibacteraceae bacterium]|nr:TonB-dependent receptor [Prolixibacteraceae bacterium]MBN2773100.1 TonB-dependent receptor [Prolixibacteraceae bacterium]
MKTILLFLFQFLMFSTLAQVEISGIILNQSETPVAGANIFLQGTYDGTTSDSLGHFSFKTTESGNQTLVASFVGYETIGISLEITGNISSLRIIMHEMASELNEVVINAGTFEASDKKKSVLLKPLDIALTASANGDVYGAFGTLPGTQRVGEEGRLFVRGGEAYETKTFMDGMLVNSPYYSKMPDLPTRGRFSPLLFNGSVFSTGGYSAEFGQALSSIVSLNTVALEPESKSSISFMTVGLQGSRSKRWENTSLAVTGELLHTGLSNRIFKQDVEWLKQPLITGSTVMFRQKTSETGMIKSFGSFNYNTSSMVHNNIESGINQDITLNNATAYFNTTYNENINEKWIFQSGVAYNIDNEVTFLGKDKIETHDNSGQLKAVFTNFTTDKIQFKFGSDYIFNNYNQKIDMDGNYELPFDNNELSAFAETEIKINSHIALRAGGRVEYSSLLKEINLMPRFSSALKTGKFSQLSMAYGTFYQNPANDYLKFSPVLEPEKSSHSILTYQYKKDTKTLRLEVYHKNYSNLVKFKEEYSVEPGNYTNTGKGFSNGFDIFWRNQKEFGKSDYWISYSWNDSERDYKDFPERATPYYVSDHNLSVVYKKFFTKLNMFGAVTYSFSSGRHYFNPNNPEFMADKTIPANDISIGLTHILYLFDKQTVLHLIVNNIFGFDNIYGYTFSNTPDSNGVFQGKPIKAPQKQMAVFLVSFQF